MGVFPKHTAAWKCATKNRSLVETKTDTTALERLVDSRINKRFKSRRCPTNLVPQPKLVLDLSKASDSIRHYQQHGTREGIEEERRQKIEKAKRDKLNVSMFEHVTQLKH